MQIIPRIYFNGNCREAIEHYHDALGAQINYVMNYGSLGAGTAEQQDLVMNAQIDFGDQKFQLADRTPFDVFAGDQVTFLIVVDNAEQVKSACAALSKGGRVLMEPAETFFSPCHCSLVDPFGINWSINCPKG